MNSFQHKIQKFTDERNWSQFYNPKDLLLGIVEEIGEIRNIVKWEQDPRKLKDALLKYKDEVEDNIGDIYWFLAVLANETGVDIDTAISKVIESNERRFPAGEVRSKHTNVKLGGVDKGAHPLT